MPRFVTNRDYQFFQHINKELVVDVIDVEVILYKIINELVDVNIYGESTSKPYYKGISLNAIIKYPKKTPETEAGFGYNVKQTDVEFRFVRKLLEDVNVYPDVGDIIKYNENFYSIDNVNEAQLVGSRPEFNQSVICETHLTRRSVLNLEDTHL
jgi:hypothetical protein